MQLCVVRLDFSLSCVIVVVLSRFGSFGEGNLFLFLRLFF